jgi:hypothetical protein
MLHHPFERFTDLLSFDGCDYGSQNFIFDLENQFYCHSEYFEDDRERVSYAAEALESSNKTR